MHQRQLRLGDVLDDYCPRERRLTNHAVVAMVGEEVKQTRCTTCDAEHEYKHAKVPRPKKPGDLPAASAAGGPVVLPKRPATVSQDESSRRPADRRIDDPIGHRVDAMLEDDRPTGGTLSYAAGAVRPSGEADSLDGPPAVAESEVRAAAEPAAGAAVDGPAHRRLIRATLPRVEGQPQAVQRQAPDFTIRQPSPGRPGRFRPRPGRGPDTFQGRSQGFDRHSGGQGGAHRAGDRPHHARPQGGRHQGSNRKRSK